MRHSDQFRSQGKDRLSWFEEVNPFVWGRPMTNGVEEDMKPRGDLSRTTRRPGFNAESSVDVEGAPVFHRNFQLSIMWSKVSIAWGRDFGPPPEILGRLEEHGASVQIHRS